LSDLHSEYAQYKSEISGSTLSDVALKDDNEYLMGENKDLHLKVKEVCLQMANLKTLLAQYESKAK
jgi:hypothetical protein